VADLPGVLRKFLAAHKLSGDTVPRILVAVSGGADSMALLGAAEQLLRTEEIELCAAHLIHSPAFHEARGRAELVRGYCAKIGVHLIVEELKAEKVSANLSPEERMREARYRFLDRAAKAQSCDYILTGHHADDQAETVLQRVLSGTGLRGLAGIPEARDNVLRPFLSVRKSDLLDYCEEQGIPFSEDPTNFSLKIPRNFIRHRLLPLVEARLNPEVSEALCRLSEWANEANKVIDATVEECWGKSVLSFQKGKIVIDIDSILVYFTLIRKYTIQKAINTAAGRDVYLSAKDLDRIIEFVGTSRTGSFLEFPGGVKVVRHRRSLIITALKNHQFRCPLETGNDRVIPEMSLRAVWERTVAKPFLVGDEWAADMNVGSGGTQLTLRYAEEGDRFYPLGSPGEKKLFRFLTDRKVSRFDKRSTPVLEREGEIIWVVGHRIAEAVRVRNVTDETWRLRLLPLED